MTGLFLFGVGATGFVAVMSSEDAWTLWRHGEAETGIVLEVEAPDAGSEYTTWARLGDLGLYRFIDEIERDRGDEVDVLIDPDDPDTANFAQETRRSVVFAFAFVALPVGWSLVAVIRYWRAVLRVRRGLPPPRLAHRDHRV